jgi:signal transduction histidine kinase
VANAPGKVELLSRVLKGMHDLEHDWGATKPAHRKAVFQRLRSAFAASDYASYRQAVAQMETVAVTRGLRALIVPPQPDACLVPVAAEDCSLLVSNLLLNALQHSPPDSAIELRLETKDATVELEIEDHGEGIDPAALPHVFDRFYRSDPSRTPGSGGTGLGLSIAKAIIERGGGSIALASEPGKGTTVTVRLPLAIEAATQKFI